MAVLQLLCIGTLLLSGHSGTVLDSIARLEQDLTSAKLNLEEVEAACAVDCLLHLRDAVEKLSRTTNKQQFLMYAHFNAEETNCDIKDDAIEYDENTKAHTERTLFDDLSTINTFLHSNKDNRLVILTVNSPCAPGFGSSGSMECDGVYSCLQGINELAFADQILVGFFRFFNKQNKSILENAVSMAHYMEENPLKYSLFVLTPANENEWSEEQWFAASLFGAEQVAVELYRITGISEDKLEQAESSIIDILTARAEKVRAQLENLSLEIVKLENRREERRDRKQKPGLSAP